MDLNLFLGNKTKVDILKYLMFKEDGLSARELEAKLKQSFPSIKNQIDKLEKAGVVVKDTKGNRWQIKIAESTKDLVFDIFLFDIKSFLENLKDKYIFIADYFICDFIATKLNLEKIGVDFVFIYNNVEDIFLNDFKKELEEFFNGYFWEPNITFMKYNEFEKRRKFADKFVLRLFKFKEK